ncbi:rhodanese-like domain-containing protein [Hymenobacter lapidiphilus]|uniref:rhodanese-like domain-containing protein n=1 Tax=Hymenobacter sp. CCM 8763 TaxID=2303334 RepID=UPI000E34E8F8|nr:rhodanese-like domain-containing protein [Hymenobacter sp. CCM 8763]RFP64068.1 rhodanese-like domain-containing protein [Hymenobacter sp. CCM 8763]
MTDITAVELKERLTQNTPPVVIDVRETWENEESHIPGSRNIPLGDLPGRLQELEDLHDQEVVVHCKGGSRSAAAKAFLQQQGFTHVRNLIGGFQAYEKA